MHDDGKEAGASAVSIFSTITVAEMIKGHANTVFYARRFSAASFPERPAIILPPSTVQPQETLIRRNTSSTRPRNSREILPFHAVAYSRACRKRRPRTVRGYENHTSCLACSRCRIYNPVVFLEFHQQSDA